MRALVRCQQDGVRHEKSGGSGILRASVGRLTPPARAPVCCVPWQPRPETNEEADD